MRQQDWLEGVGPKEQRAVTTFDIRTLADFRPPRFLCEKCLGLLLTAPKSTKSPDGNPHCPVCGVEYLPSKLYPRWRVDEYLASQGCGLVSQFDNMLKQCIDLARTTAPSSPLENEQPPLNNLLEALSLAKAFVHFTSFGIDQFFIGALKLVAQRVPVRGIVSNVDSERTLDELTAFAKDAPHGNFAIKHFLRDGAYYEAPHQKLIVVDGLLAFKGGANLTLNGWRKAAKKPVLDHVEVVTRTDEVIALHNRLFAPVWAQRSDLGPTINTAVPF